MNELEEQAKIVKDMHLKMYAMVDEQDKLLDLNRALKKQNKDLRALVIRWERENGILQESIEACQRELEEME